MICTFMHPRMKFHENVPANERNIGDQAKIMFVDAAIASAGIGTFRSTGSKTIDSQTTVHLSYLKNTTKILEQRLGLK